MLDRTVQVDPKLTDPIVSFSPFLSFGNIHTSIGEIKNTHAGSQYVQTTWEKKVDKKFEWGKMVKGRNEPCQIVQVAEVIAAVKQLPLEEVAQACYQNSLQLYRWQDDHAI
jgi:Tat protein secretion system quality control protein TatD with DNase activity